MTRNLENEEWIAWGQDLVSFGLQDKQQVRAAIEAIVEEWNAQPRQVPPPPHREGDDPAVALSYCTKRHLCPARLHFDACPHVRR